MPFVAARYLPRVTLLLIVIRGVGAGVDVVGEGFVTGAVDVGVVVAAVVAGAVDVVLVVCDDDMLIPLFWLSANQ